MPFEGYVDEDEQLEGHPVCYCAKGGDEAEGCGAVSC